MPLSSPQAILFDLDGTLADTAPDLAGAVNRLRVTRGFDPVAYELLRPVASAGARVLSMLPSVLRRKIANMPNCAMPF
jgi:phosphoglycolate phosphatase